MLGRNISRWARLAVTIVAAVVMLTVVSATAGAASNCKQVHGTFTLQPLTGPSCRSPVGICATGSYKGGLKGDSTFVASDLIPTADTPTTSVVFVTGDNTIVTNGGTIMTKDAIALRTTGAGEFAELDTIIGGTGVWTGATGRITASGRFTLAAGGEGEYNGEVCHP